MQTKLTENEKIMTLFRSSKRRGIQLHVDTSNGGSECSARHGFSRETVLMSTCWIDDRGEQIYAGNNLGSMA